jgi:hypothetical protein
MDKFMKFWEKYGWYFPFGISILSFLIGDIWMGITNLMLAIPLFIESKSKKIG